MGDSLQAVAYTFVFAGAGALLGNAVDRVSSKTFATLNQTQPLLGWASQLAAGMLLLGGLMQMLIPKDAAVPIGDSVLIFFFFASQVRWLTVLEMFILPSVLDKLLPYYSGSTTPVVDKPKPAPVPPSSGL